VDPQTLAWTRAERLTTGSGNYLAAAFSADGGRVALSIQQESEQIWEYAVRATDLVDGRSLTEVGASVLGADASVDGATILFQLLRPGATAPRFWAIRGGQPAAEIAGAEGLYAARLSPDASRFAYLKLRGESGRYQAALAVHSFAGSDRQIAPWGPSFRTPSDWSTDGLSILTGGRQLRTWPANASPARDESRVVLVPSEGNLWQGRYSPNGRWLTFVNNQNPVLSGERGKVSRRLENSLRSGPGRTGRTGSSPVALRFPEFQDLAFGVDDRMDCGTTTSFRHDDVDSGEYLDAGQRGSVTPSQE
jgi:Tol biopolymer transport system component